MPTHTAYQQTNIISYTILISQHKAFLTIHTNMQFNSHTYRT